MINYRKVFQIVIWCIVCTTATGCPQTEVYENRPDEVYEMQPNAAHNTKLSSDLLNMKTEGFGVFPYFTFSANNHLIQKNDLTRIEKKENVTFLHDFQDNTDRLECYYFFSEIFKTDSNIARPLTQSIKAIRNENNNGNNLDNISIMPERFIDIFDLKNKAMLTQLSPIASCIKIVNSKSMFPPQIHQELLFVFSFKYQKTETDAEHKWGIVNLKSLNQSSNDLFFTSWFISHTFINVNGENRVQDSIIFFDEQPSQDQIIDFIISTDFGNNDIFNYTDYPSVINIDVPRIFVYPPYKDLVETFENGLPENIFYSRVKVYNEVLVGLTSTKIIPSHNEPPSMFMFGPGL